MKVLRLGFLLMATTLCGVMLLLSLRPSSASPDVKSLIAIEHELMRLNSPGTPLDTPGRTPAVKRGPGGRLVYFYEGEWRETPPPAQDLPLLIRRPVDQSPVRGDFRFPIR